MSLKISNDKKSRYARESREWYKAHHICVQCRTEAACRGKTRCLLCNDKQTEEARKYRETHYRTETLYADKRRHNRLRDLRVAFGVCTKCGKRDADPGYMTCSICRSENKRRITERRRTKGIYPRDSYSGLCYLCNKRLPIQGKKLCPECMEKALKNLAKGRAKANAKLAMLQE